MYKEDRILGHSFLAVVEFVPLLNANEQIERLQLPQNFHGNADLSESIRFNRNNSNSSDTPAEGDDSAAPTQGDLILALEVTIFLDKLNNVFQFLYNDRIWSVARLALHREWVPKFLTR